MTHRHVGSVLLTALFLFIGYGIAYSVECATCDKNLTDCRTPVHARYVDCMKGGNARCSGKCSTDCKNDKEVQKCMLSCVKSCQGGNTCQATFTSASAQCTTSYRSCRKDCTSPR